MLKRTIEVSVPLTYAVVLASPDPKIVLKYLWGLERGNCDELFDFLLLFPSKENGGATSSTKVLDAKVFINGNSIVEEMTSRFEGVLHSLGDAVFGTENGPRVWINVLAGQRGGERVGECTFDVPIDTFFTTSE
ncbi:MAG: hypothetical protein Q7R58_00335 [bacterium]|nr:hypothetical protein [bacterium]